MFDKLKFINDSLSESSDVKLKILDSCLDDIVKVSGKIKEVFTNGGKLMICGNGGSAADSQHIATEFLIRLSHDLKRPAMPAMALTTDSSTLTAGGNDIGFENVFARSVEGIGNKGDILMVISTSGNSKNLINAVYQAKENGIVSVGLLGGNGGLIKPLTDLHIIIPSDNTQRIQEGHITVGHILCEIVEREIYG